MKVYVAVDHWDYDSSVILGVFTTQEAAQGCVDTEAVHYGVLDIKREHPIESGDVEEHEVQGDFTIQVECPLPRCPHTHPN